MGVKKIYLQENVLEAALERIRWVYREFKNVYVSFSGGKDSTVVLNLALQVAEEMGRLPVPVMFIDQEAEWQAVIDYIREVMYDPRVRPVWLQVPFKIFNATSTETPWLQCWEPGKQWIREKEDIAVKRNVYGTDRFGKLFVQYLAYHHRTQPVASLAGIRCEESPGRMLGLTVAETYKGVTWGAYSDPQHPERKHFVFSPLYDWSYRDIWKAIHDHGWPYTKIYDYQYQYGVPIREMRVSNLHHETAVRSLFYLQEIESDTWERVQQRLAGVSSAGHLQRSFYQPKKLPPMFKDWPEYRDYLLENMITAQEAKDYFARMIPQFDRNYEGSEPRILEKMYQAQISAILLNDYHGTTMSNFTASHGSKRSLDRWKEKRAETMARVQAQFDQAESIHTGVE